MLSVLSPWNVISSRMPVFSGLSRKEELRILERGAIMSYSSEQLMRLLAPVYEKTLFWTDPFFQCIFIMVASCSSVVYWLVMRFLQRIYDFVDVLRRFVRTQIFLFFLNQKDLTFAKKKRFIAMCEKFIRSLADSQLFNYETLDMIDLVVPQLLGYPYNIASSAKIQVLTKNRFKIWFFNLNYYYRAFQRYFTDSQGSGLYEIDLFRTTPSKQPKRKTKHIPLAFIAGSQSYLNAFLDLFDLLRQKGMPILLILPRQAKTWSNSLAEVQKKNNIQIVYIEDYYDEKLKEELYSLRGIFQERFLSNQHLLKKIVRIGQSNLYSQTKLIFKRLFSEYLPELVIYNKIATRILTDYGVKTLVGVRLKIFIENSFFLAAKRIGDIRKISIIHNYHTDMLDLFYDLGQVDLADFVFVSSDFDKEIFTQRMPAKSKVKILNIGNIQMQKIYDKSIPFMDYKKKFGFKEDFVVFMAGIKVTPLSWISEALEVCNELGIRLFVKTHPRETKERYMFLEKKGAFVVDDADVSLYSLIAEARTVISYASTTTLEAPLIGTPSIFYEPGLRCEANSHFIIEFFSKLGIPLVQDKRALQGVLEQFFSTPREKILKNYSEFLRLYSHRSKKNIAETIYGYLEM
jgi:hypothetical protein